MLRLITAIAVLWSATALASPRCGDASYCKESCASAYPWPFKTHADRQHCRIRCTKCGHVARHASGNLVAYTMGPHAKLKLDTLVGTAKARYCVRVTTFGADGLPDGRDAGRLYANVIGIGAGGEVQVHGTKCFDVGPMTGAATVKYASNGSALSVVQVSMNAAAVAMLQVGLDDGKVRFSVPDEYMTAQGALLAFLRENYQRVLGAIAH